jgi:signal transduction histidine kinase
VIIVALSSSVLSFVNLRAVNAADQWVTHTAQVDGTLAKLFSALQDAESAERGYLLTLEPKYADRYQRAASDLPMLLAQAQGAIADNPEQRHNLAVLTLAVNDRVALLHEAIRSEQAGERDSALAIVRSDRGRELMNAARDQVAGMRSIESSLLDVRRQRAQRRLSTGLATSIVTGVACLLLVALVVPLARRDWAGRLAAEGELRRSEEALRASHAELEDRVAERTAELQRANDGLREMDRLKSEFLATMSHELRTPLNSILGFVGLLADGRVGSLTAEQTKQLGYVRASARHLLALINDLLDVARIESGHLRLNPVDFDFQDIIAEVLTTQSAAAALKGIDLLSAAESPQLPVSADRRRCLQVVLNLVNNAVKFTREGGVRLDARIADGRLSVDVLDTGIGIAPESMALLFEAFRQVDGSSRRHYEGVGLGLHLSRLLARAMGGDITAVSTAGRGSCFTFHVPVAHADAIAPE